METDRMKELVDKLNEYAYSYYVLDKPTVSDAEYDELYDKLLDLENKTGIVLPSSPTKRVGDTVLDTFTKVEHKVKLFSLDKCKSFEALSAFVNDVKKKAQKASFTLEYKFDGLTIVCTYKNGFFVSAATRGNGSVGEDVSAQVRTIKSVPLEIPFKGELIVQGEGMITNENLKKYNEKYPNEQLKNARNAVSGAIRNLDSKETAKRNLDWFCYNVCYADGKTFETQVEMFEFLKQNNFKIGKFLKVFTKDEDILTEIEKVDKQKSNLDILIDGMVVKLNEVKYRDEFGFTSKFPKWAMAYKFAPQELSTILKEVKWQVGRTGKITPIAIIEPVVLAGATVNRATLNNYGDIERKNVSIGSRVFIRRSNEVIPEIIGLAEKLDNSIEIEEPNVCPCCKTPLVKIGALLFCPNTYGCKEQIVNRISHFASRDAMNIDGFSEMSASLLYDKLNVKDVADLYYITREQLIGLPSFLDKKIDNFLNSIENSKKVNLANFIYALSIGSVGKKTAKDIAKNFKNLDNISNAKVEELCEIRDIGEIVAKSIYDYFNNIQNQQMIERLFNAGVCIVQEEENKSDIFKGMTFVLTGTLYDFTRTQASELIEKNGGQTSSSVSKNTSYVLAGIDAGSKLVKAQSLNIKVLNEDEFKNMLKL